jgi:enoyl-CoA hydratase/carnithine racemase
MIRGFCVGGGMATAMVADIRVSAEDGRFGIPAARLGVTYAYHSLQRLVWLVGPAMAKEIMFTGRQLDAAERCGSAWGLVASSRRMHRRTFC